MIFHIRAHGTLHMATLMLDTVFITNGYTNWKDAARKNVGISQHETWSVSPGSCIERNSALHATTKDIGEHISSGHDEDKDNERNVLMKLSSNIRFLARQGIKGHSSNFSRIFNLKIPLLVPHGWSRKPTSRPTPSRCKTRCSK